MNLQRQLISFQNKRNTQELEFLSLDLGSIVDSAKSDIIKMNSFNQKIYLSYVNDVEIEINT